MTSHDSQDDASRPIGDVPDALADWGAVEAALGGRRPAVFLDFDGVLSPIVDHPDHARILEGDHDVLRHLAEHCPVAIVSGRGLADVMARAGVSGLWYAGSHGFELEGPDGEHEDNAEAAAAVPALQAATAELQEAVGEVPGAVVEPKRFAVATHYRMVPEDRRDEVRTTAEGIGARHPELRVTGGRQVTELRPNVDWDKGKALEWLLGRLDLDRPDVAPVYVGDDLTDEDALRVVRRRSGLGVVVRSDEAGNRPTYAHVAVDSPEEVRDFLGRMARALASAPTGSVEGTGQ